MGYQDATEDLIEGKAQGVSELAPVLQAKLDNRDWVGANRVLQEIHQLAEDGLGLTAVYIEQYCPVPDYCE